MAFHSIIPAGGVGSRLWPLSRATHPKFLQDLTNSGASMLQKTYARLEPLAQSQTIVTGIQHAEAVADQVPAARVLVEPCPRGTMPAIALAAAIIMRDDPDAIIGSFAADHHIDDEDAFRTAVTHAIDAARGGSIATIGIQPTSPSTAYGYIECGEELDTRGICHARSFVEKPDAALAQQYVNNGNYLWNAGIFISRADILLTQLEQKRPDIARVITTIAEVWGSASYEATRERLWHNLPDTVIDRVIAEPCTHEGRVAVVPADMGWSDIGDFYSLAQVTGSTQSGDTVLSVDSPNSLVLGTRKPVVLLGIEGAVVVETDDAILITRREHAQDVKKIVDILPENGWKNLL